MPASRRSLARGVAAGQVAGTVAIPLALHVSARIAERDPEDFLYDPTQLANALRDLIDAVDPDGVPVSDPGTLLADCRSASDVVSSAQLAAALEATRRLRASAGDSVVLAAMVPGPGAIAARTGAAGSEAAETVVALGKEFLAAGADLIVVEDETELPGATLTTLANIARFHQAAALSHGGERYGLPATVPIELDGPRPAAGVVLTPGPLARHSDITVLRTWVETVRH